MNQLFNWPPTWSTLFLLPALFAAFTVHELAHALVAFLLGDSSQVERKRLSFNPLRHVSWLGMIAFLLVGLGWAKPVWVDHTRFRIKNRAFGLFLVSVAGATANLLTSLAVFVGLSLSVSIVWMVSGASPLDILEFMMLSQPDLDLQGVVVALGYNMMMVNLLLAIFNLLPLPPLDGFQAVMSIIAMIRGAFKGDKGDLPPLRRPAVAPAGDEPAPSPAQIHFSIGLDYHKEGQLDEAIARYRQAIEHDQEFGLAYYNQGLAYLAKGRASSAASAFRAASQSGRELGVRVQADLRLRELAQADAELGQEVGPLPPPLEPGTTPEVPDDATPPLDPAVARRVWLRLSIGGAAILAMAIGVWVFITVATLQAVM
jgi:Zn-dependent protease